MSRLSKELMRKDVILIMGNDPNFNIDEQLY